MATGKMGAAAAGAVAGALAATLVTATVVLAHGGDRTKIHACVTNNSVRITGDPTPFGDPNSQCLPGEEERPLDWSATGPPGPEGSPGPQGRIGPQGLQGLPGPVGPGATVRYAGAGGTWNPPQGNFTVVKELARLKLPRGRHLVLANARGTTRDSKASITCKIRTLGAPGGDAQVKTRLGALSEPMFLMRVVIARPSIVTHVCIVTGGRVAGRVRVADAQLVALGPSG